MARSFASQGSDQISFGAGNGLNSVTAASLLVWFKHAGAPTSGNWLGIYSEWADFNDIISVSMKTTNDADNGKLYCLWRTPTEITDFTSATAWDDGLWHWLLLVRRTSGNYTELYVDGVSEASQATDPSTSATSKTIDWGFDNDAGANASFGGSLARGMGFTRTLTVEEAKSYAFGRPPLGSVQFYHELIGASPEPDWSGNVRSGTLTGTAVADHAPVGPWFGLDLGWQGAFTAAAGGAALSVNLAGRGGLAGVGGLAGQGGGLVA